MPVTRSFAAVSAEHPTGHHVGCLVVSAAAGRAEKRETPLATGPLGNGRGEGGGNFTFPFRH